MFKITKREIKENTKTTEIEDGRFGRSFNHYFEKKLDSNFIYKVYFSSDGFDINVRVSYLSGTKADETFVLFNEDGKKGFIAEVQDYIQSL